MFLIKILEAPGNSFNPALNKKSFLGEVRSVFCQNTYASSKSQFQFEVPV
jgi:hypothetical protein